MPRNLWNEFPQQLMNRVNGLLDVALPTSQKAFQLYRCCKNENIWTDSFEKFQIKISEFFSIHRTERKKCFVDQFLNRPLDNYLYKDFHLTFRTASISNASIQSIAQWAANLMQQNLNIISELTSETVINLTLLEMTQPGSTEKDSNFVFEDFCEKFKLKIRKIFGHKHDHDLNHLLHELQWLSKQSVTGLENNIEVKKNANALYLTQTEIDWVVSIEIAVKNNLICPKFPLTRGPTKIKLIDLDRAATLYNLVYSTTLPELVAQQPRIETTLLQICEFLIHNKVA